MVGSPAATAIPSRSVDLPEPFSPTKNVTAVGSSTVSSARTTGTENGNVFGPSRSDCFGATERRNGMRAIGEGGTYLRGARGATGRAQGTRQRRLAPYIPGTANDSPRAWS